MPKREKFREISREPERPKPVPRRFAGRRGRPTVEETITEEMLEHALRKNAGIALLAANELGTSRQNVGQRIAKSPRLQNAIKEAREELLDTGEGHIAKAVLSGDKPTIRWLMERLGASRGYANRTQVGFDENQIEAIVASLGGDPAKLRDALNRLGVNPDEIPG